MSRQLSGLRLFSEKEFKEADRLERIHIAIMNPDRFFLNNQDSTYLDQLRSIFVVLCENLLESEAIRKVEALYPEIRRERLYTMINDAEELFSRFRKVNKDHLRTVTRERLKKYIYNMTHFKDDNGNDVEYTPDDKIMANVVKFEALLVKLDGLDKNDTVETFDWSSLQLPTINFTSDRNALISEEAEYEEEDTE